MDQQTQWYLSRYGHPIKQLGGRYTLLHLLGRGGMADVCLVRDEQNKREVAAKVMIPDMSDRGRQQRFLREAEIAVSLHHQHIIHVYDYGNRVQTKLHHNLGSTSSDELTIPYIIMEHVKGGSLKEWLEKKFLERGRACPLDEAMRIFEQLCNAVQYVHSENKKHRDIKPANILFRKLPQEGGSFEVVLSDFGLAVADSDTLSHPEAGTLAYMAPEQRQGRPEKASDIFSLGVVLYQLCTGHLPFQMKDLTLPLRQPLQPTWRNPSLPVALNGVILQALSNEPSQRFANASLFWQATQSAARSTPPPPLTNRLPNRPQPASPPSIVQPSVPPSPKNDKQPISTSSKLPMGANPSTPPPTSSPEPQPNNKAGKKGLFSGAKKVAPSAAAGAAGFVAGEAIGKAGLPGPLQRRRLGLTPASDVPDRPNQSVPPKTAQPSRSAPLPLPETEDEDFLPPSIMPPDPGDQFDKETTTGPLAANDIPYTPPTDPSQNIDKDDDWVRPLEEQSIPANLPDTPPATGAGTAGVRAASVSGPRAVELSAPKGTIPRGTEKKTKILPPSAMADAPTQEPPSPIPAARPSTRPNRNTGKMAAAGAAGAVAGAMAANALTSTPTDTGNTSTTSSTTSNTGQTPIVSPRNAGASRPPQPASNASTINTGWLPPSRPASPRRTQPKRGRTVLIAAIVIVILLMLCSVTAVANPGGVRDNVIRAFSGNAAPPATVTITPPSKTVQDTYVMQGVPNNADPAKREITVHPLSSTQTVTKQVPLAHFHQDAVSATGTITFFNGSANIVNIASGTIFQVGNVQIVTDKEAVIPARIPPNQNGQATVPAHAAQTGTAGNIAALAINGFCCGNASITAQNTQKFTGGKDAVDYKYLKPDDVTKVVNENQGTLKSSAQDDITKKQIKNSEQPLSDIKCDDPKTATDIQPNDHIVDKNITAATVAVSVSCNAKVFDANAVQAIAQKALQEKASQDPGTGYVLADKIVTQTQPQTQQDGTLTFSVTASGVWSYQWTDAMKQDLRNKINGKSVKDAQAILNSYPGVSNAKIDLNTGGDILPSDPTQIDMKTVNSPSEGSSQTPLMPTKA